MDVCRMDVCCMCVCCMYVCAPVAHVAARMLECLEQSMQSTRGAGWLWLAAGYHSVFGVWCLLGWFVWLLFFFSPFLFFLFFSGFRFLRRVIHLKWRSETETSGWEWGMAKWKWMDDMDDMDGRMDGDGWTWKAAFQMRSAIGPTGRGLRGSVVCMRGRVLCCGWTDGRRTGKGSGRMSDESRSDEKQVRSYSCSLPAARSQPRSPVRGPGSGLGSGVRTAWMGAGREQRRAFDSAVARVRRSAPM